MRENTFDWAAGCCVRPRYHHVELLCRVERVQAGVIVVTRSIQQNHSFLLPVTELFVEDFGEVREEGDDRVAVGVALMQGKPAVAVGTDGCDDGDTGSQRFLASRGILPSDSPLLG